MFPSFAGAFRAMRFRDGVGTTSRRIYTREQYLEALKLLQNGLKCNEVAKMLGIPYNTLRNWWRGIRKPPLARWEPILSKELAYVLGALLGDGSVTISPQKGIYRIQLTVKDYEFADRFSRVVWPPPEEADTIIGMRPPNGPPEMAGDTKQTPSGAPSREKLGRQERSRTKSPHTST